MTLRSAHCPNRTGRLAGPSATISWDAAGGVGLRLDKDEW
jgi:hypothetical protein